MYKSANTLVAVAALVAPIQAIVNPGPGPGTETFLSRPGQYSVKLDVQVNKDPKALGPGYIFTSPYSNDGAYGAHIYENSGELVYCGTQLQEVRSMDSHVCNFLGKNTLCFTDAVPGIFGPGHSAGVDRFFDHGYQQVSHDFGAVGNLTKPDAHELNTPPSLHGKGFINDVFQPVPYDLTAYDGPKHGWILAGCFQQRHIENNNVQFQWCSDTHVPFYETYNYIAGNSAGNISNSKNHGTHHRPWDYFHINAIDRDFNGDYYVSSRQTHTIYKIAGLNSANPGRIIWRLGGKFSDFKITGRPFTFYSQHHVRAQSVNGDQTLISLYDNHYPRPTGERKKPGSSGKYILLNTTSMIAELVQEYFQPEHLYTPTGGQVQTLSNGNVFISWGNYPGVSEFHPNYHGRMLYYATFNRVYSSYRSYKQNWVGQPAAPPDVFAYQQTCNGSHLVLYMSWNGATEYKSWQIYGHEKDASHGGTRLGSIFKRTGYETVAKIHLTKKFYKFAYAEALGHDGRVLGKSKAAMVFVPHKHLAKTCGPLRCPEGTDYSHDESMSSKC